jgi:GH15 family glucan-1,4-alpha-glucosidase
MTSNLELGVIGNCQVASLIDSDGRHVWACLPRPDGDPIFTALLGNDPPGMARGTFGIELKDHVRSEQQYLGHTPILETLLHAGDGSAVRIIDFCPRFRLFGRIFRPVMIIRIVEPVTGQPVIRIRVRPLAGLGAREPKRIAGSHHVIYRDDDQSFRLTTDASITSVVEERALVPHHRLSFILGSDEPVTESVELLAQRLLDQTRDYWLDWVRGLAIPFEWQAAVIRAAIGLKLCTFEDTGAILAALTTSIPEAPGTPRTWDYRHCWLRDGYFTVQALNRLGATQTMESYLVYLVNTVAGAASDGLQPVYGLTGDPCLHEREVPTLAGYRGMGPVRIGNDAWRQNQHDVYGAVILAASQAFYDERLARRGDVAAFREIESAGERCVELYDQPDAGLWEYRGRARVHTFSSVMCWAGVDRLARIAIRLGLTERATYWRDHGQRLHARILSEAWDPAQNSFTESWGQQALDASLLLLPELGFIAADDPRFAGTLTAVERSLRRGPYLLRYHMDDDFGAPENSFNICTFWYINALAAVGRRAEARELFENMLARRTRLGFLSEDLDMKTGELWGNFPQTYSLVGIITSAMRLSRPWEDAL